MVKSFSDRQIFWFYLGQVVCVMGLCVIIFFTRPIAAISSLEVKLRSWHVDKLVHFAAFFMITWTWLKLILVMEAPHWVARLRFVFKIILILVISISLGAGVELIQGYLVYRQATLGDFYSHLLGSLVAVLLFLRYAPRRTRKTSYQVKINPS